MEDALLGDPPLHLALRSSYPHPSSLTGNHPPESAAVANHIRVLREFQDSPSATAGLALFSIGWTHRNETLELRVPLRSLRERQTSQEGVVQLADASTRSFILVLPDDERTVWVHTEKRRPAEIQGQELEPPHSFERPREALVAAGQVLLNADANAPSQFVRSQLRQCSSSRVALPAVDFSQSRRVRSGSSYSDPKLLPLFNEGGKLVPTSHRWGHRHRGPVSAGRFLFKLHPRIEGRVYRSRRSTSCVTILFSAQPRSVLLGRDPERAFEANISRSERSP